MMLSLLASCASDADKDPSGTTDAVSDTETQASTDTDVPEEEFIPHYTYTPSIVADPDFYFVENGASDYVIVYRENADNATNYNMACELQSYIEKITGVQLPLVTDASEAVDHEIVIGLTNREEDGQFDRAALTDQGFEIDVRENGKVFIAGGDDLGTQYGVYHFVDEYLGCGLYSPEFEYIPDYDSLGLAYGEDIQVPVLISRTIGCKKFYGYWTKMKLGGHTVHAGHTLPVIMGGNPDGNDPCLSAEITYQTVLQYVLDILEQNPDQYYIGLGQADGPLCDCDLCLASYEENGASGHYIKFLNRIAEEIKDDYPNTLLCTFAYGSTTAPPKNNIVAADSIVVQFCTILCCRIHELEGYNYGTRYRSSGIPDNASFGDILNGWDDTCKQIAIYDYTPNYGSYHSITPNLHDQLANIRLFAERGSPYVYIAGPTMSELGEFDELRSYLISKALWDPYMSEEEYLRYMNKFLCEYYGPGWEYIRAFIDLAEEETADNCMDTFDDPDAVTPLDMDYINALIDKLDLSALTAEQLKDPASVDWDFYYDQIPEKDRNYNMLLAKGYEYFAKAAELAENDEQWEHIDQSSIQLDVNYSTLQYKHFQIKVVILQQIYKRAMDACLKNGTIDEISSYTYIYSFDDAVLDAYLRTNRAEMRAFNEALYEKMIKYGITHIMESNNSFINIPKEKMEFANPPVGGFGTSYTSWYPHA